MSYSEGPVPPVGVYEHLRDDIISGVLAPGQRLVETTLAAKLGVSRTPIREALRLLVHDGLVGQSNGGLRVTKRNPQELFDIYNVRIPLEVAAARGAAERYSQVDLLQLTHFYDEMESVDSSDYSATTRASRRFHEAVWTAAHNTILTETLKGLDLYLRRYPVTAFGDPTRYGVSLVEHHDLLSAIRERDVNRAGDLMSVHFSEARDIRFRLYALSD